MTPPMNAGDNRKKDIEGSDILVIGREEIAPPSGRMGMRLVLFMLFRRAFHDVRGQLGRLLEL